jgi:hypothetical protein
MAYHGASSFGSNDSGYESGIVEVFDEPPRPVLHNKDFARDLARQRQNMLAEELSRLDAEEYQHDILEHMLHMDVSLILLRVQERANSELGRNCARCRLDRYPNGDTVVHAAVPTRLSGGGSLSFSTDARNPFLDNQPP